MSLTSIILLLFTNFLKALVYSKSFQVTPHTVAHALASIWSAHSQREFLLFIGHFLELLHLLIVLVMWLTTAWLAVECHIWMWLTHRIWNQSIAAWPYIPILPHKNGPERQVLQQVNSHTITMSRAQKRFVKACAPVCIDITVMYVHTNRVTLVQDRFRFGCLWCTWCIVLSLQTSPWSAFLKYTMIQQYRSLGLIVIQSALTSVFWWMMWLRMTVLMKPATLLITSNQTQCTTCVWLLGTDVGPQTLIGRIVKILLQDHLVCTACE